MEDWREAHYAEYAVRQRDPKAVVDHVEALLGLPRVRRLPPVDTATKSVRILAAVMEAQAFALEPLRAECGWLDSSGMEGGHVREWLASVFPTLALAAHAAAEPHWQGQARFAARVWKVGGAALDLASGNAVRFAQPDRISVPAHADVRTAAEWMLTAAR